MVNHRKRAASNFLKQKKSEVLLLQAKEMRILEDEKSIRREDSSFFQLDFLYNSPAPRSKRSFIPSQLYSQYTHLPRSTYLLSDLRAVYSFSLQER
jgi:hypothetical protein